MIKILQWKANNEMPVFFMGHFVYTSIMWKNYKSLYLNELCLDSKNLVSKWNWSILDHIFLSNNLLDLRF